MYFKEVIEMYYSRSSNNRGMIEKTGKCGCFYCLKVFSFGDITEWVDKGSTAMCPSCDKDTIIPDTNLKVLRNLNKYYFIQGSRRKFVSNDLNLI